MINVSNNFLNTVKSNSREFSVRIVLTNGSTRVEFTEADIKDFEMDHSTDGFSIGNAVSKQLKLTMFEDKVSLLLAKIGTRIDFHISLNVNGNKEEIKLGIFYIDEIVKEDILYKITAYDLMYTKGAIPYVGPRGDINIYSTCTWLRDHLALDTEAGNVPNRTFHLANDEELTVRDMYKIFGSLNANSVYVNPNEKIRLARITITNFEITPDQWIDFKCEEEELHYKKLTIEHLTGEYVYERQTGNIEATMRNDYITRTTADDVWHSLENTPVQGFEAKVIGMPHLELFDNVWITDLEGNSRECTIYKHILRYNGGLTSEISCDVSKIDLVDVKKQYYDINKKVETFETRITNNAREIQLKASQSTVDQLTNKTNNLETQINLNSQNIQLKASQSDLNAVNQRVADVNLRVDGLSIDFTGTSNNLCPDSNLRAFQEKRYSPYWGSWSEGTGFVEMGTDYWLNMNGYKYRGFYPGNDGGQGNIYVDIEGIEGQTDYRIEFDCLLENLVNNNGALQIYEYNSGGNLVKTDGSLVIPKNSQQKYSKTIMTHGDTRRMRLHWIHPGISAGHTNHMFVGTVMVTRGLQSYTWQPKTDELASANFGFYPNGEFQITTRENQVVLSANGMPNQYCMSMVDNCDTEHPANLSFFIDREINHIQRCKLFLSSEWFRAYSKATTHLGDQTSYNGGGSTSSAGGATTSSGGGDHKHTMFNTHGSSGQDVNSFQAYNVNTGGSYGFAILDRNNGESYETYGSSGSHTHSIGNHTHTIPNHQHSIPGHSHGIDYGLYEENIGEVHYKLFIDGQDTGVWLADGAEFDAGPWITQSGRHTIRVQPHKAGSGDFTRARVSIIMDLKVFMNGR